MRSPLALTVVALAIGCSDGSCACDDACRESTEYAVGDPVPMGVY